MEGIFVMLALYLLFRAFAKKGRSVISSAQRQIGTNIERTADEPTSVEATPQAPVNAPFTTQQKLDAQRRQQEERKQPVQRLESMQRQKLQTTLRAESVRDAYTGSLGAPSKEGKPSTEGGATLEGTPSVEGKDIRDPAFANASVPSALQSALAPMGTPELSVLPLAWNGSELVRAVVMSEVLGKPGKWSDYHG